MLIAIAIGINTITRVLNCRDSQAMVLGPPQINRPALDRLAAPVSRRRLLRRSVPRGTCPTPVVRGPMPGLHANPPAGSTPAGGAATASTDPRGEPPDALDKPLEERGGVALDRDVQGGRPAPGAAPVRDRLAGRERAIQLHVHGECLCPHQRRVQRRRHREGVVDERAVKAVVAGVELHVEAERIVDEADDRVPRDGRAGTGPAGASVPGNPVIRFIDDALRFYMEFHSRYDGFYGAFVHDPFAVAAALDPSLVRTEALPVDVELDGTLTTGETVTDWRRAWGRPPTLDVAVEGDAAAFFERFIERVGGLAARVG